MTIVQKSGQVSEIYIKKEKLISREIDSSSLSSFEIKDLLDVLDWSSETEKRVIVDLCRIISVRGDTSLITGEQN